MSSNETTTMQAIVQESYGNADVLHTAQLPRPEPGANEVLVQVRAAGLDRGTWHLMAGLPYLMRPVIGFRRPRNPVPGLDVAGVVEAVGEKVTGFAVGDEVYGFGKGTFAEYAVAPADQLAPKPKNLSFEQAAVVPVSASTALVALTQVADVQPGQQVLVIGASGGVGSYAVQLAKALGAEVTGVCSPAKIDLVRSLGAQRVLDYTRDDWADGSHHYDLVLDIGGRPTIFPAAQRPHPRRHCRVRRRGGRRQVLRWDEPRAPWRGPLAVRQAATEDVRGRTEDEQSRAAHRVHRGWPGDAEH